MKTLHATLALFALTLAACGQKGPLYLPDTTQGEVVTRPTQTGTTTSEGVTTGPANSPSTPDDPGRAASPAPEVTAPEGAPPAATDKDKNKQPQPPK